MSNKMNDNEEIDNLSFEQAVKELEAIVEKLENSDATLENAVSAYERGSKLKNLCQMRLNEARMKVEKIKENEKGETSIEDFDV